MSDSATFQPKVLLHLLVCTPAGFERCFAHIEAEQSGRREEARAAVRSRRAT